MISSSGMFSPFRATSVKSWRAIVQWPFNISQIRFVIEILFLSSFSSSDGSGVGVGVWVGVVAARAVEAAAAVIEGLEVDMIFDLM